MKKTKSQNLSLDINSSFIVYISSEVDGWEFWKPSELRRKFLAGTLENFDFVFTYSSLEHSGLGRTPLAQTDKYFVTFDTCDPT